MNSFGRLKMWGRLLAFSVLSSRIKLFFLGTLLGCLLSACGGGLGSSGPSSFGPNLLTLPSDQGPANSDAPAQNESGATTISGSYPSGQPTNVAAGKRPDPNNPD